MPVRSNFRKWSFNCVVIFLIFFQISYFILWKIEVLLKFPDNVGKCIIFYAWYIIFSFLLKHLIVFLFTLKNTEVILCNQLWNINEISKIKKMLFVTFFFCSHKTRTIIKKCHKSVIFTFSYFILLHRRNVYRWDIFKRKYIKST